MITPPKYQLTINDYDFINMLAKYYTNKCRMYNINKTYEDILSDLNFLAVQCLRTFDKNKGTFKQYFSVIAKNYFSFLQNSKHNESLLIENFINSESV